MASKPATTVCSILRCLCCWNRRGNATFRGTPSPSALINWVYQSSSYATFPRAAGAFGVRLTMRDNLMLISSSITCTTSFLSSASIYILANNFRRPSATLTLSENDRVASCQHCLSWFVHRFVSAQFIRQLCLRPSSMPDVTG